LGLENYCVGVNLFGAQFRARQLVSTVVQSLRDNGLPPAAIELEITENIILQHDAAMIVPLRELRNLGVRVAFDDYGTGYASLSLLKRFPLSRLKIDRSFIRDLCLDPKNAAVVTAILYLARSFGLDVTAEGVETERQDAVLRELECVDGQGYLYGRPMPAQQILASIAEQVRKDKGLAGAPRLARPISVAM
jgi:EAL domain-containing protein (putative c-di-GMP-specific phosphodiesterase class I)